MADDFEPLRTIRAPLGELDDERATRMRARALASVLTDTGTDRPAQDRAAQPNPPAPPIRLVDPRPDRTLELVGAITVDGGTSDRRTGSGGTDRSTPGRGGSRPFLVAVAAAAVIAVLIGVTVARSGGRDTVVSDQPRPTSVSELSANAATLVDRPLAAGEYAHISIEQGGPFTDEQGAVRTHVVTRETWSTREGLGRDRHSATEIVEDGRTVSTYEPERVDEYPTGAPAFGSFDYETVRSLPTDPAALRAVLQDGTRGPADDAGVAHQIGELLVLDVTPPAVRAAALAILAEEGATVVESVTDRGGHTGTGIVVSRSDGMTTVFVVTRDGLLLGSYEIPTGTPLEAGRATNWTTLEVQDRLTALD